MFEGGWSAPRLVDALLHPADVAVWAASARPGAHAVTALSVVDAWSVPAEARIDLLVALERQIAWLHAAQQRVLTSVAGPSDADRWAREDVSCALRLSSVTAADRLAVADALTHRLPATLAALERGEIGYLHAMSLAEASYSLDDAAVAVVEQRVLPRAAEQTVAQFRASVRRAVASANPSRIEDQRAEAMLERRVCVTPRDDGMAELWALLPAEGAAALMRAVDALASVTSATDPRSADQRRADALVDLGVAALHDPLLPRSQGMRPAIQVTVALSTLLGLDDQPADLDGHGPIPAAVARRLAADPTGTWRRLITEPGTGHLLEYGRTTYRPRATSPTSSSPETGRASSWGAADRPAGAISITGDPGTTAGAPTRTIWPCCAGGITGSSTRQVGE